MSADTRLTLAFEAILHGIEVPPVRLEDIQQKISISHSAAKRPKLVRFAVATAAVAVFAVTIPSISPALIQGIEARYRNALLALGGMAPPRAPQSLLSKLIPKGATLATAQSRVTFTIVPPAGLPSDILSSVIQTIPIGIYSTKTHSWRAGPPEVTFAYRRTGGREFALIAERYEPNGELPSKYMFEAEGPTADGRPVLVRHEHFAWRNGDQIMTATEGSDISSSEIRAIQSAMHGVAVPRRNLHTPNSRATMELRVITRP